VVGPLVLGRPCCAFPPLGLHGWVVSCWGVDQLGFGVLALVSVVIVVFFFSCFFLFLVWLSLVPFLLFFAYRGVK
jgi:hypothetical protein